MARRLAVEGHHRYLRATPPRRASSSQDSPRPRNGGRASRMRSAVCPRRGGPRNAPVPFLLTMARSVHRRFVRRGLTDETICADWKVDRSAEGNRLGVRVASEGGCPSAAGGFSVGWSRLSLRPRPDLRVLGGRRRGAAQPDTERRCTSPSPPRHRAEEPSRSWCRSRRPGPTPDRLRQLLRSASVLV